MKIRLGAIALAAALALGACDKKEAEAPKPAEAPSASVAKGAEPGKPAAEAPKPEAPRETVEVVLWHAYRAGEKDALEQVVADYNAAQQEVAVRLQAVPYDPFVDKVRITVPRGQGPDLFIFAHNMIGSWVEEGVLEPLSGHVSPETLEQFTPQSVKALVYQQNLYGLPLAFKSLALFWNKALMPEAPATMEALLEAVTKVQKPDDGLHGLVYDAGLLYNHAVWIHAFGGRVFDEQHQPAFATPEQEKALAFAKGLYTQHEVLPKGMNGFMVTSLFNDGKAVAVLNGPWFRAEIKAGLDYGVATIPTVEGRAPAPLLGIEAVFVSKTSAKKEAAVKAALHLAGAASAKVRLEVGKQPVAHAEALAAGAAADPVMEVFRKQAEVAVIMDASPEMQLVWSAADMAINGVIFGDKDAKDALARAQAKMVEDIGKRGR